MPWHKVGKRWVITVALISHKRMSAIHFHPLKVRANFIQPLP